MNTEVFKNIIAEWLEEWKLPSMIRRETPAIDLKNLSDILAIAGPRRAGKTYYMYQLIGQLLKNGVSKEEILFIDFEDYRLTDMIASDIELLFTAFFQLTNRNPLYLFFDEVQNLPQWSRVLRTLHNKRKYRIVVSGSNSRLLSREISTELRGRYRDVLILPFSFSEILHFRNVHFDQKTFYTSAKGRLLRVFDDYLKEGGFPEVVKRDIVREKRELLQSYYRSLFYRDLIERYGIRAKYILESMMSYCMDTFGNLFSISAFSNLLKSNNLPGSKKTISNYLQYLRDAFFVILNDKFDFSPRKRLMNPKKVYLFDVGFGFLSTTFSENRGRFLENIVAVELYRRRVEMFYSKNRHECDFVLKHGTKPDAAIQVCWALNPDNQKREFRGLVEAMRNFNINHGLVLTYDEEGEEEIEGRKVHILPVWKWLLTGSEFV